MKRKKSIESNSAKSKRKRPRHETQKSFTQFHYSPTLTAHLDDFTLSTNLKRSREAIVARLKTLAIKKPRRKWKDSIASDENHWNSLLMEMKWLAVYVALSRVPSLKQLRSIGLTAKVATPIRQIIEKGPPKGLVDRFAELFDSKIEETMRAAVAAMEELGW